MSLSAGFKKTGYVGCKSDIKYSLFYHIDNDYRMEAAGLNQIFGHREDEFVYYEPRIAKELPKLKKPDAIYGLRQTRNIENLLNDTVRVGGESGSDGVLVHELLGESPISEDGDRISFPFLLLEATSAKAAESDWDSIQLQSSFPVRTFLKAQQSLQDIAGTQSKWKAGPLVWLLMSRGEDWRVCAADVYNEGVQKPGTDGTTDYVRSSLFFI